MRVVLFGFQTWGHKTLETLVKSHHDVVAVVTHPVSGQAYESIWSDSVEDLARDHGIEVHVAKRPDEALVDRLRQWAPDIIVANNWRTWLPPEIFAMPRHGTVNLHDSLLPAFTGFSPVIWALISGAAETGLTAHRMDGELDTGDVITQRSVPIGPTDTSTDLVEATIELIPEVLLDALERIETGTATWTPQDLSKRTFFHKRHESDSCIDWTWSAEDLDRLVRAMSDPYPNAYTFHKGQRIRIIAAHVSDGIYGGTPGRIFIKEGTGMVIVCGPDAHRGTNHGLVIDRVRTDGGDDLDALDHFVTGGGYLTPTA
ncbi:methionyl-tRNA formyltransferase [Rhodococcus sp. ARC_M12]|uniref:methionyl-tRNA formyltransferase n=1 Tax=unclassified Rhodococcus (in: high G+C Gram-positive bacteria) TaxID=192944 RepID=UPI001FB4986E|nr:MULTISPECIES: methionyl-tRNA formyltransferase [unclassified Rhodococcus (in: high G+C Gram-positive bacteria)]MCJ0893850.1 methionyl-tRNA formyltransferase [Rhodococcus sp. ARC_M5]MCJ0979439.1 methionyl-tRNA formyltransferase [Rhodococcus sp. ARC_M12]